MSYANTKTTLITLMMLLVSARAFAEIKFFCGATAPDECAFSVVDAKNGGTTNFFLESHKTHGLNDNFRGGSYCVVVAKPHAQIKSFPPDSGCYDARNPADKGKVGHNIQPGHTYQ
jgi:hypothetical protein